MCFNCFFDYLVLYRRVPRRERDIRVLRLFAVIQMRRQMVRRRAAVQCWMKVMSNAQPMLCWIVCLLMMIIKVIT